jgi:hypothetical protein
MIGLSAATGEFGRLVVDQLLNRVPASDGEFGRLVVDQLLNRVPASDVTVAVRDVHKAADLADRGGTGPARRP